MMKPFIMKTLFISAVFYAAEPLLVGVERDGWLRLDRNSALADRRESLVFALCESRLPTVTRVPLRPPLLGNLQRALSAGG